MNEIEIEIYFTKKSLYIMKKINKCYRLKGGKSCMKMQIKICANSVNIE